MDEFMSEVPFCHMIIEQEGLLLALCMILKQYLADLVLWGFRMQHAEPPKEDQIHQVSLQYHHLQRIYGKSAHQLLRPWMTLGLVGHHLGTL